jgi:hypothetical protein
MRDGGPILRERERSKRRDTPGGGSKNRANSRDAINGTPSPLI